ncbi:MAG: hypothetical protein QNJ55_25325 [Xenococcus sp. MO_188.B8]|nr:hypothetical protein [Xenococcus sp. MO_188.B8]
MESEYLRLDLLNPLQLPTNLSLSLETKKKVSQVLKLLLIVIDDEHIDQNIEKLNQALFILGETNNSPITDTITQTSLTLEKIQDYDHYFRMNHTQTEDIGITVLSSIIVAFREMLLLCKSNQFNHHHVEQLKQGYKEYIDLLIRIFKLAREEL